MSDYVTEKKFMVAEGNGGELYIFISAKADTPSSPQIIYDGKDHAIFLRNRDQKIILDYFAHLKQVENIPLDWKLIGLSTWDKAKAHKK